MISTEYAGPAFNGSVLLNGVLYDEHPTVYTQPQNARLLLIREVPTSNLHPDTSYPGPLSWFFGVHPGKSRDIIHTTSPALSNIPSNSLFTNHTALLLEFLMTESLGISVSITTDLSAGLPRTGASISGRGKRVSWFPVRHRVQTGNGAHPLSYVIGTGSGGEGGGDSFLPT